MEISKLPLLVIGRGGLYWDQPMVKLSTGKSLWGFEIDGILKNPYEDFCLFPKPAAR